MSGFFLEIAWKSTVVAAIGLLLLGLLRHRSAADRVFLLRLTIFLLLALPLVAAFGPALEVEQPEALAELTVAQRERLPAAGDAPAAPAPVAAGVSGQPGADWPMALLALYGLGVGAVLSHLASGIWTLRQWTRAARPVVHPLWGAAQERAEYRTGVKRPVDVLGSADVSAPLSWGLRRPAVLLDPKTVRRDEEAEAVLAHEFAHVARADWPMLILSRLMLALFWFNPLAWLLDRRLAEQSEEAADMDAVRRLDPGAYAQALLSAVSVPPMRTRLLALPATPMVAASGLGRRIHRILDDGARNRLSGSAWTVLAGCSVLAAAAAIATLQIVPARAVASPADLPAIAAAELQSAAAEPVGVVPAALAGTELAKAVSTALAEPGAAPAAAPQPAEPALAPAPPEPPLPVSVSVSVPVPMPLSAAVSGQVRVSVQQSARSQGWAAAQEARAEAIAARAEWAAERAADRAQEASEARAGKWAEAAALRAMGITPDYMAEMASAFRVRRISEDDATELRAMNISPEMVRGMVNAGYARISIDELHELAAMSVTPDYVRGLASAGFRGLSIDELVELKAVGVTAAFAREAHEKGLASCAEELAELRTSGRG